MVCSFLVDEEKTKRVLYGQKRTLAQKSLRNLGGFRNLEGLKVLKVLEGTQRGFKVLRFLVAYSFSGDVGRDS